MGDILKLARIQILVIIPFVFFKAIRSRVLAQNPAEIIQIFLLSFPNFCEGIVGVMTLTMIGILVNQRLKIKPEIIYIITTLLATVYVVTQELKIHNLGGENIYDPNDLVFSILGLAVGYLIINRIKPRIQPNPDSN